MIDILVQSNDKILVCFLLLLFVLIEAAGYSKVKLDATNLTALEVLQLINKHVTPFTPKEEVVNVVKTKSAKRRK